MLALLCSGQGTQHTDMFRLTGNQPEAAALFAAATKILGTDPRDFVLKADPAALAANRTAQILCVTQALATASLLADTTPRLVAGYSVGALAACSVAGMLDAEAALKLAAQRADAMDAASGPDDGLAFVRGLSRAATGALAAAHRADIAIVNPNDSFIVGGTRDALQEFLAAAQVAGATRAGLLAIHVASHTPRLASASTAFENSLRACDLHRPALGNTLISALDGAALRDPQKAIRGLANELSTTLHWADCLTALVERGATQFLELGPGRALADMAASASGGSPSRSVEDFTSRAGLLSWLGKPEALPPIFQTWDTAGA